MTTTPHIGDKVSHRCVCEHDARDHLGPLIEVDGVVPRYALALLRCKGGRCECPRFAPQSGDSVALPSVSNLLARTLFVLGGVTREQAEHNASVVLDMLTEHGWEVVPNDPDFARTTPSTTRTLRRPPSSTRHVRAQPNGRSQVDG